MEKFKVGQRVVLKVVKQKGCDGCFFGYDDTCHNPTYNDWADGFECQPEDRSDGKNVIFKQVETV